MREADHKSAHAGAERGAVQGHDAKRVEIGVQTLTKEEDYKKVIAWHREALAGYQAYESARFAEDFGPYLQILNKSAPELLVKGKPVVHPTVTANNFFKKLKTLLPGNDFITVVTAMHGLAVFEQDRIGEMIAINRSFSNKGSGEELPSLTSTQMVEVWAHEHHVIELIRAIALACEKSVYVKPSASGDNKKSNRLVCGSSKIEPEVPAELMQQIQDNIKLACNDLMTHVQSVLKNNYYPTLFAPDQDDLKRFEKQFAGLNLHDEKVQEGLKKIKLETRNFVEDVKKVLKQVDDFTKQSFKDIDDVNGKLGQLVFSLRYDADDLTKRYLVPIW